MNWMLILKVFLVYVLMHSGLLVLMAGIRKLPISGVNMAVPCITLVILLALYGVL